MFCLRTFSRSPNSLFFKRLLTHPNPILLLNAYRPFSSSTSKAEPQKTSPFPDKRSPADDLAFQVDRGTTSQFSELKNNMAFIQQILGAFAEHKDKSSLSKEERINLIRAYSELGQLYEEQANSSEAQVQYKEALSLMHDTDLNETVEAANVNNALGRINLKLYKFGEAEGYLEKAKNIYTKLSKTENVTCQLTKNRYMSGVLYEFQGETDKALEQFKGILKKVETEEASFEKDFDLALVYQHMGNVYSRKGDSEKAKKYWDQSVEVFSQKYEECPSETLNFHNDLTYSLIRQGLHKEAAVYAEKSLKICRTLFGDDHPKLAETLLMVSPIYSKQGDHTKSLEILKEAAEIFQDHFEQYHGQATHTYLHVAELYLAQGLEDEAEAYFGKAIKIAIKGLGEHHPKLGDHYLFWGGLLKDKTDDADSAILLYSRALDVFIKAGPEYEPKVMNIYYNLGVMLFDESNLKESLTYFKQCVSRHEKGVHIPLQLLQEIYDYIGSIYFQQEKYKDGVPYFHKAGEVLSLDGDAHNYLDEYFQNLGRAYEEKGLLEEAVEFYRKALETATKNRSGDKEVIQAHVKLAVDALNRMQRNEEAEELKRRYYGESHRSVNLESQA